MIGSASRSRQDVVNIHDAERKMRFAADAHALSLSIEPVPMRPVVRQVANVCSNWRNFKGRRSEQSSANHSASLLGRSINCNSIIHQLHCERCQVNSGPLPFQSVLGYKCRRTAAKWIKHHFSGIAGRLDDPVQQRKRFLFRIAKTFARSRRNWPDIENNVLRGCRPKLPHIACSAEQFHAVASKSSPGRSICRAALGMSSAHNRPGRQTTLATNDPVEAPNDAGSGQSHSTVCPNFRCGVPARLGIWAESVRFRLNFDSIFPNNRRHTPQGHGSIRISRRLCKKRFYRELVPIVLRGYAHRFDAIQSRSDDWPFRKPRP